MKKCLTVKKIGKKAYNFFCVHYLEVALLTRNNNLQLKRIRELLKREKQTLKNSVR